MVIEMTAASFTVCEKGFDLMSFQNPHTAGPSMALVVQVFAFAFYIFATEKHVFYSLLKKKSGSVFPLKCWGIYMPNSH